MIINIGKNDIRISYIYIDNNGGSCSRYTCKNQKGSY